MPKSKGFVFSTDREILSLKPQEKRYSIKDKMNNGLFIEVKETGVKTWHYRYSFQGKQQRLILGRYPIISLKEARKLRDIAATQLAKNISPKNQPKQNLIFKDYAERYLTEVLEKDRTHSYNIVLCLKNDIYPTLGHLELMDIGVDEIRHVIWQKKQQGFDAAANQIRGLLKRMFDYAMTLGLVTSNPVALIPSRHVYKAKARDRYLSDREIQVYYQTLLHSNLSEAKKSALLLSLLSLLRKSELLNSKWHDIDFDQRTWHIPETKADSQTGKSREMVVYLSDQMIEILKQLQHIAGNEPYVFPGRFAGTRLSHGTLNVAQQAALVLTANQVEHFTIHDLRRTASTHLNEQGFNRDAIEKCLNHSTVGVRGVYNKAEYAEERKIMMQQWSDYIFNLIYVH